MGLFGVLDHSGIAISFGSFYSTRDHDFHHSKYRVNYAFPFPFMDIIHNTYYHESWYKWNFGLLRNDLYNIWIFLQFFYLGRDSTFEINQCVYILFLKFLLSYCGIQNTFLLSFTEYCYYFLIFILLPEVKLHQFKLEQKKELNLLFFLWFSQ